MTHHDLTDLLERAADRTDVGPPPVDALLRGVRRRRRRHAVLGGVAVTAVSVAVAIAVPVLLQPGDDGDRAEVQPDIQDTTSPPREIDLDGSYVVIALVRRDGRPAPATYRHARFHMSFRNGTIHASDNCNVLSGGYALHGDRFHLRRDVTITLAGCMPPPPRLFERLEDVVSVARDQGGTYLEDASGSVVIALTRH
jgi:heat shock protein HslJ